MPRDPLRLFLPCQARITLHWKSKFLYRYRPEGIFRFFFRPDSGPPPVHMLLQRKKANSFVPAIFFSHGMAFLEKRGGLVPVYVFIFPACKVKITLEMSISRLFQGLSRGSFKKSVQNTHKKNPPRKKQPSLRAQRLKKFNLA